MNTKFKELKQTSLFIGLNDQEFEAIINCFEPKILSFRRGESIALSGYDAARIGVITAGKASSYYENAIGDRALLYTVESGNLLGAVSSFSEMWHHYITLAADTDCTIAFLKVPFFFNICSCENKCSGYHIIINNLLRIFTQKSVYLYRRTMYLSMKSIRQKVCSLLYERLDQQGNSIIILPMNRKVLAEYLNVPRPSLSRELCLLKKEGIIDFYRNIFRILDIKKIELYAAGLKAESKLLCLRRMGQIN